MGENQQFEEQFLDYLSPSFGQYEHDDWSASRIELEAKESGNPPGYELGQRRANTFPARNVEQKRLSLDLLTKEFHSAKTFPIRPDTIHECCAFQRLEQARTTSVGMGDVSPRKSPSYQLIAWVITCRDTDPNLDEKIKRTCPMAKCTFSCDPDDDELIRHITGCAFTRFGKYKCPYHNNELEAFMIPQPLRIRKRWNRTHSLREAFRDICKLGSRGLHKAFRPSNKKRRFDGLESLDETKYKLNAVEIDGSPQAYRRRTTTSDVWPEKRQPPARRSAALQPQIQSQIREAAGTVFVSELQGHKLDVYNELPSVRFSAAPQDLPQIVTTFQRSGSETDTSLPSPLSSTPYVSSERFESPISPQDLQEVVSWAEAMESSSGHQVSLDAMVFSWPMNQRQSSQSGPSISGSRSPNHLLRAKGLRTITLDTSVGTTKPVSAPRSNHEDRLASSPEEPEILSLSSTQLFEELRSTVHNTYTFTYAQLSRAPRLQVTERIISRKSTPAQVFSSGWDAVENVLDGKLPQNFWLLFCLAQLAFACGQIVWENQLKHQLDEIVDELRIWSQSLRSPHQRECYLDVIEQIFVGEELKSTIASPDSMSSNIYGSPLNEQELLSRLRNGVVIRLCLQFLCTFEFLQHRLDRIQNARYNALDSLFQTTDSNDHSVAVLKSTIIRPLLARDQFRDLIPVLQKASDLLDGCPSTLIRELELFLICHARYYTKNHALHLQFRCAVIECCSNAALQLTGKPEYQSIRQARLILDIASVRQCQKDLSVSSTKDSIDQAHLMLGIPSTGQYHKDLSVSGPEDSKSIDLPVQELYGSPVVMHPPPPPLPPPRSQNTYYPAQGNSNYGYSFSPYSYVQTPISTYTASPSTAASSNGPSIWTPISAHTASPATATDSTFASPFKPPFWPLQQQQQMTSTSIESQAMFSGKVSSYTDPNFPLTLNTDYHIFPDQFPQQDASLFAATNYATAVELPTPDLNPEHEAEGQGEGEGEVEEAQPSKGTRTCDICQAKFHGKEEYLTSNLRRHVREAHNSGRKLLECGVCRKLFKRSHNLKVHSSTVHAKEKG